MTTTPETSSPANPAAGLNPDTAHAVRRLVRRWEADLPEMQRAADVLDAAGQTAAAEAARIRARQRADDITDLTAVLDWQPGQCRCRHLDLSHNLAASGARTACSVSTGPKATPCGCTRYQEDT
jgi:hypothetical protein